MSVLGVFFWSVFSLNTGKHGLKNPFELGDLEIPF